ncbi:C6 transcription factor [Pyrenophora tritici-repentis]|uniref:Putative C6 transcription factor n=1 Tax=Pyrenophora tritici-repentis TaxID=45151 RepID=A0A2W1EB51_9PLEO|nr:C6 zinc finger domain protein [Pyrenophora tritici-repentis]KAF7442938.1 C6 zinc finger domain protein [Pyrenophora tritici-repentis]KAF7568601.1 putative C6 transcription factor [Pyrenophora tritici-repentis]KAG9376450.1 C6 zinc finger domain protein [Pyrenophora tritici-repentis]KAI0575412.1 C6 zinc finger domain protein [Pyrenophora tritici-repentis]
MNRTTPHADDDNGDSYHDNHGDSDDTGSSSPILRQREVVKAWDELYDDQLNRSEHLLFCSRSAGIELSTLHPPQAQIFKLWQIYLENVDPMLKLTHTPTLQPRIIDAASDLTSIPPNTEALMFAIYCMAVFSLTQNQCQNMFGTPRGDVIRGYQLGAREALLNCRFLKTSDRECLTALHLYLISLKSQTDPRSLASMLSTAVRIAQRMGIDSEAVNSKHPALEAELRRRLWWSLVLFDSRIAELTDPRLATLLPTWDCKVPLSVNDSALRKDIKNPPVEFEITSEALFAVTRCRIGNYIRHSASHLDFVNPSMKYFAEKSMLAHGLEHHDLATFEAMIETRCLARCDAQNPLHFMTIWWTRYSLAKIRFANYLSTRAPEPEEEATEQRDEGLRHACNMLECDTALMQPSKITGYRWLIYLHFPFPAYVHLARDLKQRPLSDHASRAWEVMSANCEARFMGLEHKDNPMENRPNNPFFSIFAGLILQAWAAREAAPGQSETPTIVARIKQRMDHMEERAAALRDQLPVTEDINPNAPVLADQDSLYPLHGQYDQMNMGMEPFPIAPTHDSIGFESTQWNWSAPNWSAMPGQGW